MLDGGHGCSLRLIAVARSRRRGGGAGEIVLTAVTSTPDPASQVDSASSRCVYQTKGEGLGMFRKGAVLSLSLIAVFWGLQNLVSVASPFDGMTLSANRGAAPGSMSLAWTGGQPTFRVYRSPNRQGVKDPANLVGTTDFRTFGDTPPPGAIFYYEIASPCVYKPPEFCNGIDDDCDGTIDGPGNPCGTVNFFTDLATAPEPPTGWTQNGGGARSGVTITNVANTRYYTRVDLALTNREAWAIQAAFSAPAIGAPGEKGPRMWARFTDPDAP